MAEEIVSFKKKADVSIVHFGSKTKQVLLQ
jgi:hypothetical protein